MLTINSVKKRLNGGKLAAFIRALYIMLKEKNPSTPLPLNHQLTTS